MYFKKKDKTDYPISKEEIYEKLDVYNPDTFMMHIKELDLPWVPAIWNSAIKNSIKRGHRIESTFGKYYQFLWLRGFRGLGYADSERLQEYYKD